MSSLEGLPSELFDLIVVHLLITQLANMRLVSQCIKNRIEQHKVWQTSLNKLQIAFHHTTHLQYDTPFQTYRHFALFWLKIQVQEIRQIQNLLQVNMLCLKNIMDSDLAQAKDLLLPNSFFQIDVLVHNEQTLDQLNQILLKQWYPNFLGGSELYLEDGLTRLPLQSLYDMNLHVPLWTASLTVLYLNGCHLKDWPEGLTVFKQLNSLYLDRNELSHIPDTIQQLSHLTKLSICNNQLCTLPNTLLKLTSLQVLKLGNKRAYFPSTVNGHILRSYTVQNRNLIETLPAEIAQLTHLKRLSLPQVSLRHLSAQIAKLPQLQYLNLRDNKLNNLPAELTDLEIDMQIFGNPVCNALPWQLDKPFLKKHYSNYLRHLFFEMPLRFTRYVCHPISSAQKTRQATV